MRHNRRLNSVGPGHTLGWTYLEYKIDLLACAVAFADWNCLIIDVLIVENLSDKDCVDTERLIKSPDHLHRLRHAPWGVGGDCVAVDEYDPSIRAAASNTEWIQEQIALHKS